MNWHKINPEDQTTWPPKGKVVNTKIDDQNGIRNEQKLILDGNRFWFPDKSMYVYYCPTHWSL